MPRVDLYQQQVRPTNQLPYAQARPAQAVQIPQYQAQALQTAGNAISQTASIGQQLYTQELKTEAALWGADTVSKARLDWTQEMFKRQNEAKGAATGFTQSVKSDYDKYMKDVIERAPNEFAKQDMQAQLTGLKTHIGQQAMQFENHAYINFQAKQFEDTIRQNAKVVTMDASQASPAFAGMQRLVEGLNIPQDMKNDLIEQARKTTVAAFGQNELANNPQGLLNMLKPTAGKFAAGTPGQVISDVFTQAGGDPLTGLVIGDLESKLDINAKNPESSASGIFQFIGSTAAQYGLTKENKNDLAAQSKAAAQLTKDNTNYLRSQTGKEPTRTDLYLAHLFGAQGAVNLLASDKDTPIKDVVGGKVAKANHFGDKTVGQVLNEKNKLVKQSEQKFISKEQGIQNPFIKNIMTAEEASHFRHQAEQQSAQIAAKNRFNYQQLMLDHEAMAYDGKEPEVKLTQEQIMSMYPDDSDKGLREFNKYQATMMLGHDVATMSNMTLDERNRLVASYSNKMPEEFGYAEAQKRREELTKANDVITKQIMHDPVSFITGHSNTVSQNYRNMLMQTDQNQKQLAANNYYSSVIAAQKQQGIAFPKILSKTEEAADVEFMQKSMGQDMAQMVTQLSDKYGKYWPQAYQQLASNDHFPNAALVIAATKNPNTKIEIGNIANIKLDDLQKNVNKDTAKAIGDSVQPKTSDFVNSLPLDTDNQKTINAYRENFEKLSLNYVTYGADKNDAMIKAGKVLFDAYSFKDNKVLPTRKIRIPNDDIRFTPDDVISGTEAANAINIKDLLIPSDTTGMRSFEQLSTSLKGRLKDSAVWVTNDDETGLNLRVRGYNGSIKPVIKKDGKQYSLTWEELKELGKKKPDVAVENIFFNPVPQFGRFE